MRWFSNHEILRDAIRATPRPQFVFKELWIALFQPRSNQQSNPIIYKYMFRLKASNLISFQQRSANYTTMASRVLDELLSRNAYVSHLQVQQVLQYVKKIRHSPI